MRTMRGGRMIGGRMIGASPMRRALRCRARRVLRTMLAVTLTATGAACDPALGMRGTLIDPPKDIPNIILTRADGSRIGTTPPADGATVLFFGYTHCPDVCPTTLADWKRVKTALGDDASGVQWIFVSIDPERDTPAIAQQYAARFDSSFVGVSADSATLATITTAFGIAAVRGAPGADAGSYDVSHSSQTFLVDDKGRWRTMYSFGSGWEALVHDLERLL